MKNHTASTELQGTSDNGDANGSWYVNPDVNSILHSQSGYESLSTQNLCRRQLIIHEVCVLDLNRTNFIMAARGSILGNFGLSDCVTALCMGQCKSRHLKVCGIMKRTCYFQTNGISCILNWDVRCLWCQWDRFHVLLLFWTSSSNFPHLIGEPFLLRKLKSAFANKIVSWFKQWLVSY